MDTSSSSDADWVSNQAPHFESDTNAPQSALSLPISKISSQLIGRKVRLYGRIVDYHPSKSLILLFDDTPNPTAHSAESLTPTILVDTRIISKSAIGKPLPFEVKEKPDTPTTMSGKLSLEVGRGVCVVGWIEKLDKELVKDINRLSLGLAFSPPPPLTIAAILISNTEDFLPTDEAAKLHWRGMESSGLVH